MTTDAGVLAIFDDPSRAAGAVKALRGAGIAGVRASMPAPFPELLDALGETSKLGWGTFTGAVVGVFSGFALCIGTSLAWPVVTGGKEIVSLPPFVVIAFELAILLGALATLTELTLRLRRARRSDPVPLDPRFSADRIGLFVAGRDGARAEEILRAEGAEEVRRVG
jgi:hypothetical protein